MTVIEEARIEGLKSLLKEQYIKNYTLNRENEILKAEIAALKELQVYEDIFNGTAPLTRAFKS